MPIRLSVTAERWPIAGSFTISRGAKTEAEVVVATLADGSLLAATADVTVTLSACVDGT